jgi:hypothetical protein
MFLLLPQRHGLVSSLSRAQVVIKVAWYGDVRFQQRGLIELHMAEKLLKMCTVSRLLIKALLVVGSITVNRRHLDGQFNGIVQLLRTGRLRLPFLLGTSFPLLLGHRRGDFGRYYVMWLNR